MVAFETIANIPLIETGFNLQAFYQPNQRPEILYWKARDGTIFPLVFIFWRNSFLIAPV